MGIRRTFIFAAQHFAQPAIDVILEHRRHLIERLGVNHVAQRISKQSRLEIEIAQRSAATVARPLFHELRGKTRGAGDRIGERRLAGEQHRPHDGLRELFRETRRICFRVRFKGRLQPVRREHDQILDMRLMRKNHQRHDVAVRNQIRLRIEASAQIGHVRARRQVQVGDIFRNAGDLAWRWGKRLIPHVRLPSVRPGDVPSAPTFFEGTAIGGDDGGRVDGFPLTIGQNRKHQDPWNELRRILR